MKRQRRQLLDLEHLESRWVPANIKFLGGTLSITPSAGESALNLVVKQSATTANSMTVTDFGKAQGVFNSVRNVSITGGNGADSIAFDVNGNTYTGNLTITSSNGPAFGSAFDDVEIGNSSTTAGGIGGNVTILLGNGDGLAFVGAAGQTTIGGSVLLSNPSSRGAAFIGNNPADIGDLFPGGPSGITRIGRDLTITGFILVDLGDDLSDTVGGNLTVTNSSPAISTQVNLNDNLTIGRNVNISQANGDDLVALGQITINGTTSVYLGNGFDEVDLGIPSSVLGTSAVFNGNVSVNTGSGDDTIDMGPLVTIAGNLKINSGSGDNDIAVVPFPGGTITVFGNVSITAGNGDNFIGVSATIFGNLNTNLGNGDNFVITDTPPGGTVNLTTGNGNNLIVLVPTVASSWLVNFNFGTGSDSLFLSGSPSSISGSLNSQNPGGNDFENVSGWTIVPPWSSNF